jgi:hypothetical protein
MREKGFGALIGAALTLVVVGTLAYTLGDDWSLVDGFYFAVATLTTPSIALGFAMIELRQQDHEEKAVAKAAKHPADSS